MRVIKYIKAIDKNINVFNGKNITARKHLVKLNNDCVLITNMTDKVEFPKEKIMEIYRSRWDIETFFGFIKNNCKFLNMPIDYNYDIYQKTKWPIVNCTIKVIWRPDFMIICFIT